MCTKSKTDGMLYDYFGKPGTYYPYLEPVPDFGYNSVAASIQMKYHQSAYCANLARWDAR